MDISSVLSNIGKTRLGSQHIPFFEQYKTARAIDWTPPMNNAAARGQSTDRLVGALAIATSIAGFALLAAHPGDQARNFAEVVQEEVRNQQQNLIVHDGYVIVLSVQILCFGFLSETLTGARLASRAGITFFAIGAAWMCVSLLFDGLIGPAVAARYAGQPETVRPLFSLIGAIVRFAMPLGLGFQATGVFCWGAAMLALRLRIAGAAASLLGAGAIAAVIASAIGGVAVALMAAFAAIVLWPMIAGLVLVRANPATA